MYQKLLKNISGSFLITGLLLFVPLCHKEKIRQLPAKIKKNQYILISFDGMPTRRLLDFSEITGIRFTFFISAVYYVTRGQGKNYRQPGYKKGRSAIGFGGSRKQVIKNKEMVYRALYLNNEIASHLNGHSRGTRKIQKQRLVKRIHLV